eukprot:7391509-Prymnesium_polylepis.4
MPLRSVFDGTFSTHRSIPSKGAAVDPTAGVGTVSPAAKRHAKFERRLGPRTAQKRMRTPSASWSSCVQCGHEYASSPSARAGVSSRAARDATRREPGARWGAALAWRPFAVCEATPSYEGRSKPSSSRKSGSRRPAARAV